MTASQFRHRPCDYFAIAQHEPIEIFSRGRDRRAVVVSAVVFDRAREALEDLADIQAVAEARRNPERVSFEELVAELGPLKHLRLPEHRREYVTQKANRYLCRIADIQ